MGKAMELKVKNNHKGKFYLCHYLLCQPWSQTLEGRRERKDVDKHELPERRYPEE